MSEATDEDLPPLGEPTSPRRTGPASRVVRRRTAVAAAIGVLVGFGAGFELERLRKASSESADRVAGICDRIQNTDITNTSAWTEIKQEIEKLP